MTLEGDRIGEVSSRAPLDEVPDRVRSLASTVAGTILGRTVEAPPIQSVPLDIERRLQLAISAVERHDISTAFELLREPVLLDSDLPEAHFHLALVTWWYSRPPEETLPRIRRALSLDLDPAQRSLMEGVELFVEHDYHGAVEHFRAAARDYPDHRDVLYGLFEALYHSGQGEEAMVVYRRLRAIHPRFKLAVIHALEYYLVHGDLEDEAWILAHTDTSPTSIFAQWPAIFDMARGDNAAAIERIHDLEEALDAEEHPDVIHWLRFALVRAYVLDDQIPFALSLIRRGAELSPGADHLPLTALYTLRGDVTARLKTRARLEAFIAEQGMPGNLVADLATLDLPSADPELLAEHLEALDAHDLALPGRSINGDVLRALLAGGAGDAVALAQARKSPYREARAVAAAFEAEASGDTTTAVEAWHEALSVSVDGRYSILYAYFIARLHQAAGDGSRLLEACEQVLTPRMFHWHWGATAPPCLAWSAERALELKGPEAALPFARRLDLMRRPAPADDPLRAVAQRVLALASSESEGPRP